MIIRKVAVPLINEKILQQAEHCYIATAGISNEGFEFFRTRIPPKCKMDIVTGLDELTSPIVLKKILSHYQGRINLSIYTRNPLHANVFVIDLPFRKSVGFVGSGTMSLEGVKDHEELFWKVADPKDVSSLMSWFTTYFQFAVPLTDEILREYELIYPEMKRREVRSKKEKFDMIALTASSFQWEAIKFRNQFFKKEDYQVVSNENAAFDNAALRTSRTALADKLYSLYEMVKPSLNANKLKFVELPKVNPAEYIDQKVNHMCFSVLKGEVPQLMKIQVGLGVKDFFVRLLIGSDRSVKRERHHFHEQLNAEDRLAKWLTPLTKLSGYTLEVAGARKPVETFQSPASLLDFLKSDESMYLDIVVEKVFSPGDPAINNDVIQDTIIAESGKLVSLMEI